MNVQQGFVFFSTVFIITQELIHLPASHPKRARILYLWPPLGDASCLEGGDLLIELQFLSIPATSNVYSPAHSTKCTVFCNSNHKYFPECQDYRVPRRMCHNSKTALRAKVGSNLSAALHPGSVACALGNMTNGEQIGLGHMPAVDSCIAPPVALLDKA